MRIRPNKDDEHEGVNEFEEGVAEASLPELSLEMKGKMETREKEPDQ